MVKDKKVNNIQYVGSKAVRQIIDVNEKSLQKWARDGDIEYIETPGGKKLYNLQKYLLQKEKIEGDIIPEKGRVNVIYARVPEEKYELNLKEQVKILKEKYPDYSLIKDISNSYQISVELEKLINLIISGRLSKLAFINKDILPYFEIIKFIMEKYSDAEIFDLNIEIDKNIVSVDKLELVSKICS